MTAFFRALAQLVLSVIYKNLFIKMWLKPFGIWFCIPRAEARGNKLPRPEGRGNGYLLREKHLKLHSCIYQINPRLEGRSK